MVNSSQHTPRETQLQFQPNRKKKKPPWQLFLLAVLSRYFPSILDHDLNATIKFNNRGLRVGKEKERRRRRRKKRMDSKVGKKKKRHFVENDEKSCYAPNIFTQFVHSPHEKLARRAQIRIETRRV